MFATIFAPAGAQSYEEQDALGASQDEAFPAIPTLIVKVPCHIRAITRVFAYFDDCAPPFGDVEVVLIEAALERQIVPLVALPKP